MRLQQQSIGRVPTDSDLIAERFFDEAGGMQLVVHSPLGARINRGFGLALRKRFCGSFNMELQAAATDDAVVLSLGSPQTFPLESLPRFLTAKTVAEVLAQALLGSPLFAARWRWTANRSLAVLRSRSGKRVPFALQRMQADDLLAAVFPDLAACQENVSYPIDIPDHPLVKQTMDDCLHEATDIDALEQLLRDIESGAVRFHVIDTVEPSPFAHEILNAKPYAFLDDAPLEERRTRAVSLRHVLPEEATDLARLEPAAIERVRDEARPVVRDADELYELLVDLVVLHPEEGAAPPESAAELLAAGRAGRVVLANGEPRLFALERLAEVRVLHPDARHERELALPEHLELASGELEPVLDAAVRGHLAVLGPVTARQLATRLGLDEALMAAPLARLEGRGVALRGQFDPDLEGEQFCDRSLLARIHRYTLARLRREIEPVSARDYLSFLLRWQHVHPENRAMGEGGALEVIEQLAAFEAPAAAWESDLLAARIDGYKPALLDALCLGGAVAWGRLAVRPLESGSKPTRVTPIAVFPRADLEMLLHCAALEAARDENGLRGTAEKILSLLQQRGALFAREIEAARLGLPVQVEEGLKELIARGRISCDGFAPLRRLLAGQPRGSRRRPLRGGRRVLPHGVGAAEGRWSLLAPLGEEPDLETRAEATAQRLLVRYGVVFRDVLAREWVPDGWRHVHRALRRLEARGLVRGGRFVTGFMGEQFALPEAIPKLRAERKYEPDDGEIRISAADPLNLAGILTPGPRVPAGHTRYLVYRNGLPVSVIEKGRRVELAATAEAGHGQGVREG